MSSLIIISIFFIRSCTDPFRLALPLQALHLQGPAFQIRHHSLAPSSLPVAVFYRYPVSDVDSVFDSVVFDCTSFDSRYRQKVRYQRKMSFLANEEKAQLNF